MLICLHPSMKFLGPKWKCSKNCSFFLPSGSTMNPNYYLDIVVDIIMIPKWPSKGQKWPPKDLLILKGGQIDPFLRFYIGLSMKSHTNFNKNGNALESPYTDLLWRVEDMTKMARTSPCLLSEYVCLWQTTHTHSPTTEDFFIALSNKWSKLINYILYAYNTSKVSKIKP